MCVGSTIWYKHLPKIYFYRMIFFLIMMILLCLVYFVVWKGKRRVGEDKLFVLTLRLLGKTVGMNPRKIYVCQANTSIKFNLLSNLHFSQQQKPCYNSCSSCNSKTSFGNWLLNKPVHFSWLHDKFVDILSISPPSSSSSSSSLCPSVDEHGLLNAQSRLCATVSALV